MEKIEQIMILGQPFDLIKLLGDMVLVQPHAGGPAILVSVWSIDQLAAEPTVAEPSNVLSMEEMGKCLKKSRKSDPNRDSPGIRPRTQANSHTCPAPPGVPQGRSPSAGGWL
jgi:hypothetical protein